MPMTKVMGLNHQSYEDNALISFLRNDFFFKEGIYSFGAHATRNWACIPSPHFQTKCAHFQPKMFFQRFFVVWTGRLGPLQVGEKSTSFALSFQSSVYLDRNFHGEFTESIRFFFFFFYTEFPDTCRATQTTWAMPWHGKWMYMCCRSKWPR